MRTPSAEREVGTIVVGAGQAGLSAAYHLKLRGADPCMDFVVLDANDAAGGAWQHRWKSLTMRDVHGVASLPGLAVPDGTDSAAARDFVPSYFDDYEQRFDLPIERPVKVGRVEDVDGERLRVVTDRDHWITRSLINATGTWDKPFMPYYPGAETFTGRQVHTVDYEGPDAYAGQHVVVVGGGASAVQILGELATLGTSTLGTSTLGTSTLGTSTTWVTRRPTVWRTTDFDQDAGRAAVALVEDRVRRGLPPRSVVSVTGLLLRPQEQAALELGAYERRPMFARIEPSGVRWADGGFVRADTIIWATGFRPSVSHLAPLKLREPSGGIRLVAAESSGSTPTMAARNHRIQLVGYGPSASTIGANRAGRVAARNATRSAGGPRENAA